MDKAVSLAKQARRIDAIPSHETAKIISDAKVYRNKGANTKVNGQVADATVTLPIDEEILLSDAAYYAKLTSETESSAKDSNLWNMFVEAYPYAKASLNEILRIMSQITDAQLKDAASFFETEAQEAVNNIVDEIVNQLTIETRSASRLLSDIDTATFQFEVVQTESFIKVKNLYESALDTLKAVHTKVQNAKLCQVTLQEEKEIELSDVTPLETSYSTKLDGIHRNLVTYVTNVKTDAQKTYDALQSQLKEQSFFCYQGVFCQVKGLDEARLHLIESDTLLSQLNLIIVNSQGQVSLQNVKDLLVTALDNLQKVKFNNLQASEKITSHNEKQQSNLQKNLKRQEEAKAERVAEEKTNQEEAKAERVAEEKTKQKARAAAERKQAEQAQREKAVQADKAARNEGLFKQFEWEVIHLQKEWTLLNTPDLTLTQAETFFANTFMVKFKEFLNMQGTLAPAYIPASEVRFDALKTTLNDITNTIGGMKKKLITAKVDLLQNNILALNQTAYQAPSLDVLTTQVIPQFQSLEAQVNVITHEREEDLEKLLNSAKNTIKNKQVYFILQEVNDNLQSRDIPSAESGIQNAKAILGQEFSVSVAQAEQDLETVRKTMRQEEQARLDAESQANVVIRHTNQATGNLTSAKNAETIQSTLDFLKTAVDNFNQAVEESKNIFQEQVASFQKGKEALENTDGLFSAAFQDVENKVRTAFNNAKASYDEIKAALDRSVRTSKPRKNNLAAAQELLTTVNNMFQQDLLNVRSASDMFQVFQSINEKIETAVENINKASTNLDATKLKTARSKMTTVQNTFAGAQKEVQRVYRIASNETIQNEQDYQPVVDFFQTLDRPSNILTWTTSYTDSVKSKEKSSVLESARQLQNNAIELGNQAAAALKKKAETLTTSTKYRLQTAEQTPDFVIKEASANLARQLADEVKTICDTLPATVSSKQDCEQLAISSQNNAEQAQNIVTGTLNDITLNANERATTAERAVSRAKNALNANQLNDVLQHIVTAQNIFNQFTEEMQNAQRSTTYKTVLAPFDTRAFDAAGKSQTVLMDLLNRRNRETHDAFVSAANLRKAGNYDQVQGAADAAQIAYSEIETVLEKLPAFTASQPINLIKSSAASDRVRAGNEALLAGALKNHFVSLGTMDSKVDAIPKFDPVNGNASPFLRSFVLHEIRVNITRFAKNAYDLANSAVAADLPLDPNTNPVPYQFLSLSETEMNLVDTNLKTMNAYVPEKVQKALGKLDGWLENRENLFISADVQSQLDALQLNRAAVEANIVVGTDWSTLEANFNTAAQVKENIKKAWKLCAADMSKTAKSIYETFLQADAPLQMNSIQGLAREADKLASVVSDGVTISYLQSKTLDSSNKLRTMQSKIKEVAQAAIDKATSVQSRQSAEIMTTLTTLGLPEQFAYKTRLLEIAGTLDKYGRAVTKNSEQLKELLASNSPKQNFDQLNILQTLLGNVEANYDNSIPLLNSVESLKTFVDKLQQDYNERVARKDAMTATLQALSDKSPFLELKVSAFQPILDKLTELLSKLKLTIDNVSTDGNVRQATSTYDITVVAIDELNMDITNLQASFSAPQITEETKQEPAPVEIEKPFSAPQITEETEQEPAQPAPVEIEKPV